MQPGREGVVGWNGVESGSASRRATMTTNAAQRMTLKDDINDIKSDSDEEMED